MARILKTKFIEKFNKYAAEELTKATLELMDITEQKKGEKYILDIAHLQYEKSKACCIAKMISQTTAIFCNAMSDVHSVSDTFCEYFKKFGNDYTDPYFAPILCSIIDRILKEEEEENNDGKTKEDFMAYFNSIVTIIINSMHEATEVHAVEVEERVATYCYVHQFMNKAYYTIDSLKDCKSAKTFVKNTLEYLDDTIGAKNSALDENERNRYIETRHIVAKIAAEGGFLNENE